jgi:hypothetical protein
MYPVFFLSMGQTKKYIPYMDPRTREVILSAKFARAHNLMVTHVVFVYMKSLWPFNLF